MGQKLSKRFMISYHYEWIYNFVHISSFLKHNDIEKHTIMNDNTDKTFPG